MPRIPLPWLAEHVELAGRDALAVAAALAKVGLEEEAIHSAGIVGPLVVGQVVTETPEAQRNGKTIHWCTVDVGPDLNTCDGSDAGAPRGIICGAHNFGVGDKVIVALPGAVLPGPFPITARKTYGHLSDGMICSARELGLGDDHSGIIVLASLGLDPAVGTDVIELLHLNEEVIEVNVTPDRGYCFSVRGIARELSHATGATFRDPALLATPPATSGGFAVEIDDDAPIHGQLGCDRFGVRIVRGCKAYGPSPAWMQRRLTQAGMRPIALGVDITNYVMLEFGQPLHAYDLAGLVAPIVVRRAQPGEQLVTLDGVDRVLDPQDLLITDSPDGRRGGRVLGLAGVMGGAWSEVGQSTTDLLIEGAHFDPVSVARSSRRHKLSSEAARRFERGVDPQAGPAAIERVVQLLIEYGGGRADDEVTDVDRRAAISPIPFDPTYPGRHVGLTYPAEQVRGILEQIGCTVQLPAGFTAPPDPAKAPDPAVSTDPAASTDPAVPTGRAAPDPAVSTGPVAFDPAAPTAAVAPAKASDRADQRPGIGGWLVTAPSWRPDLQAPIDLVEEVARIAGYELIGSVVPPAPPGGGLTRQQQARRSIARALADAGLVEVLTYPFIAPAVFDALGYPADDGRRQAARLANPLDQSAPLLRTALLQTLPEAAKRNLSRGQGDIALFEIGEVVQARPAQAPAGIPPVDRRPTEAELDRLRQAVPPQPRHLAAVMIGDRTPGGVWGAGRPADWADAVQAARLAAAVVHVELVVRQADQAPWHPGRCAALGLPDDDGAVLGYAGELHPAVVAALELPARAVGFELDLDALIAAGAVIQPAKPVSTQPVAKEDFAFIVPAAVPVQAVADAVRAGAGAMVEDAVVFDVYAGDQVGEGNKSVAVALRLRAPDHTLTAEEIAVIRRGAIAHTTQALGARLRS